MTRLLDYLLAGTLVYFAAALLAVSVHAAPPKNADPSLSSWFQSLENPTTGISCCREYDGHVMRDEDWRVQGDHYQIRIAGQWVDVPASAVLDRIPNPTSGVVAFFPPDSDPAKAPVPVYCLVRATES